MKRCWVASSTGILKGVGDEAIRVCCVVQKRELG